MNPIDMTTTINANTFLEPFARKGVDSMASEVTYLAMLLVEGSEPIFSARALRNFSSVTARASVLATRIVMTPEQLFLFAESEHAE